MSLTCPKTSVAHDKSGFTQRATLRQFGERGGNALRLVTRERFAPKPATKFLFEIHVGKGRPLASFTTKQLSSSWTDHGGGKWRP
jgi:hypothetical protein